jgi:hypothetical protein
LIRTTEVREDNSGMLSSVGISRVVGQLDVTKLDLAGLRGFRMRSY